MIIFFIIFLLFSITFAELLFRIVNRGKEECSDDFKDIYESLYSTFLVVINMVDFTKYDVVVSKSITIHAFYFLGYIYCLLNELTKSSNLHRMSWHCIYCTL